MKIVLVGSTGYIGRAILERALAVPAITSIIALSRRDLPSELAGNAKVKTVIVKDFLNYSDDVKAELAGAELCIWSLGGRVQQFVSYEEARDANVTFLHAGTKAMIDSTHLTDRKFRFVYCSGMLTEWNQEKSLLFLSESRKLKGEAEVGLLQLEKDYATAFELFIGRPAGVLETQRGLSNIIYGPMGIGKQELAAALVHIGLNGAKEQVTENGQLKTIGRQALSKAL